jgi:transposase InsO family protein
MIRAKRIIADSIKDHLIPQVSSKNTPKDMFDALTRMYEGRNINRKMNLRTQLKNTRMQKGETVQDYFSRVSQFKEQLEAIGDKLDEDELVMTTLNGLTRPWDAFIQTICARKEKLQFDSLWEECVQEEARVANREVVLLRDEDQALAAHAKGGKGKSHFQKETHFHKESHSPKRFQKYHKGQRRKKYFSSYQCYHCDKMGHIAKNCPAKREEYKRRNNKRHHAHAAEDDEPPKKLAKEEIEEYVLFSALSGSVTPGKDTWLIDSGASKHMTGQKNTLSSLVEKNSSQKVSLGDDYQYPIKGLGEATYKLDSGTPMRMKDVLYVPGLKKNLLSISALDKKGFRVAFVDGEVLMWSKGKTIEDAVVIGIEEGGLYKLKGHSDVALTHSTESPCELWHRRLAHINYKALPYVSKVVTGLPELKVDHEGVCKGCAQGKNTKNPFPKSDSKAEGILELVHSDVCGPMPSTSLSGYVYYVSFIDDYSRKTWVYFLKSKDEVLGKFKEFKALVENLSERKIKKLRSDNGGEYTSNEFGSFCRDVGIKRELTTPYNPQQNGVAERKNRTIMEAVKTMIHDQDLPMHLWAEATRTTVYVQNRLSHSALGFKTPEEMFTGKKPEVSHLKIFGCPVFVHIPKEKRTKLDPSGKKGIFVGYCEVSKAFRIYIPGYHHIEINRDVTFDEDATLKRSRKCQLEEVYEEEPVAPRVAEPMKEVAVTPDDEIPEDHDMIESQEPPRMTISHKRKPAWARELIQDAEKYGAPEGTMRQSKKPKPFSSYVALMCDFVDKEPTCFEEVVQKKEWMNAMTEEYQSIIKNDVWEVVPKPKNKDVVSSKWIYKIKHAADESIEKYKARFVARGFSQKEGIDYEETFAPVARYTSIRTIIALAAKMKWKLHQMDVKTTFLNGVIEEEVYIEQPQGFEVEDRKTHVCRLKKALYGLKQAPRAWYGRIDSFLTSLGFTKSKVDSNLYFKVMNDEPVVLLLYVDDLFLTGEENLITDCKRKLAAEFEMKDLGPMHYFLGLEVWQSPEKIFLNQGKYAVEILKKFDMLECKSMATPMETNLKLLVDTSSELVDATLYRQIIGSLMYLTNTRPDICFVVNTLSQYLVEPRRVHLVAAKHVMRYLKGTLDYGLCYTGDHDFRLYGYTDSDWAGSASDRKSTSGCCFSLGSAMTSWKSRKQSSIALSTTEAEYIAACSASCEAIWLRKLLTGLFDLEMEATMILCDNQSCIKMTENPVFHDKTKHIEIWYHYIRDMVQKGVVKLQYVGTDEQVADVLTKPLSRVKFEYFRDKLGVV